MYGGAIAVDAFVIKLAVLSNIHAIAAVASNCASFVESMPDKSNGDTVIDHRKGANHVVEGLRKAAGADVKLAFDAVLEKEGIVNLDKVLVKGGMIATVFDARYGLRREGRLGLRRGPLHARGNRTLGVAKGSKG